MKSFRPIAGPNRSFVRLWQCSWLIWVCAVVAHAVEPRAVHLQRPSGAPAFDGWGTSLCWFANAVGKWPEPQRSEIADALFAGSGLELTVVRYNIGGGESPGHQHMPWFRQMDGFETAAGNWNWQADPGQRWMLEAAVKRGANRLEAFSNSPPYWMTISRCASGAAKGDADNLDPNQETAFAEYLAQVVLHFRDAWGVSFDTLDPMNEPYTDYWHVNGNQEGCHFDHASQARLIQQLRTVLDQKGLAAVKISAADETNYDRAIETWKSYDAKTRSCVGQINAHAYATEHRTELRELARASGKPLVMSEVDGPGAPTHDHASMPAALTLAQQIIDDLRDLRPLRWVVWQAVEDEEGQATSNKNWGLIHADLKGDSHTWTKTKKYHALGQFSKHIHPGAVLVPGDSADTVAAFDPKRNAVVIVTRNAQPAVEAVAYDLSAFGSSPARVDVYRTSATEDEARLPSLTAEQGRLVTTAAAQSITTYVVRLTADSAGH